VVTNKKTTTHQSPPAKQQQTQKQNTKMTNKNKLFNQTNLDRLIALAHQSCPPDLQPDTSIFNQSQEPPKQPQSNYTPGLIIPTPALNKQSQTQDKWIKYFNSTKEQDFATLHDFLTKESLNNKEFIKNAREIMKDSWIVTPIRITYNPTNLEATITDHCNSNKRTPRTTTLELPVYRGYGNDNPKLSNVLTTKKGLSLFQFLLNSPQASQTELSDKLESFSDKSIKNSYIWTPDQSSRESSPVRVLGLDFNGVGFHFSCFSYPVDGGPAFGVSVGSGP
jgi:hypothetical protein